MSGKARVLALLMCLAVLAGCASRENYRNMLTEWIGAPEMAIIDEWGVPDRHYETEGRKFLVYDRRSVTSFPGTPPRTYVHRMRDGGYAYSHLPGTPGTVWYNRCETTFVVIDGAVREVRFDGNSCVL